MAAAMTKQETGFPWFERHAIWRGREIFAWTIAQCGEPCPTFPLPFIGSSIWISNDAIRKYYRDDAAKGRPVYSHWAENDPGFIAKGPRFETWEDAERWLFGEEQSS
ncbi:MAG: hypothetical protein LC793_13130 [Thermomicrobia bacterium]|nr:hypothetical protein [Thermomicrobia bacterium]MCA1723329.1 hypothetical protein [Thermomicrobia bacterium]